MYHAGHFVEKCEYGHTHAQCRCPSYDKQTVRVVCDMPQAHAPVEEKPVSTNRTLHDRLTTALLQYDRVKLFAGEREQLADDLEQAVKEWLLDYVKEEEL